MFIFASDRFAYFLYQLLGRISSILCSVDCLAMSVKGITINSEGSTAILTNFQVLAFRL